MTDDKQGQGGGAAHNPMIKTEENPEGAEPTGQDTEPTKEK